MGGGIFLALNVSAGGELFPDGVFVAFVAAVIALMAQWEVWAYANLNLTSRVAPRRASDLVTLHGPGEVHRKRRSV